MGLGLLCCGTEMEKRRAQWSETAGSVESTEEMIVEEERVISKSRVWPKVCVGNVMCWVRVKSVRRLMKWEVYGQSSWSTWKLKSPVITSSELDVTRFSRREENSEMKTGFDDLGGRYIVSIMNEKELLGKEKRAQIDSKEEKVGIGILSILMCDWKIMATPPPFSSGGREEWIIE